jgi:hypothetical protein
MRSVTCRRLIELYEAVRVELGSQVYREHRIQRIHHGASRDVSTDEIEEVSTGPSGLMPSRGSPTHPVDVDCMM